MKIFSNLSARETMRAAYRFRVVGLGSLHAFNDDAPAASKRRRSG